MINISEQISAARKAQLEAHLTFMNSFTSKAMANAEKIVALNLTLTRETLAKSTAVMYQAFSAREPGDLLALSTGTPDTFNSLLAYGRDLMAIAAGGAMSAGDFTAAPVVPPPSAAPQESAAQESAAQESAAQESAKQQSAAQDLAEQESAAAQESAALMTNAVKQVAEQAAGQIVEQAAQSMTAPVAAPAVPDANPFEAEAAPHVTATAIAKAVGSVGASHGAPQLAAAPVPSADTEVTISGIKPVDATPPVAHAAGTPELVQQDASPAKTKRKK